MNRREGRRGKGKNRSVGEGYLKEEKGGNTQHMGSTRAKDIGKPRPHLDRCRILLCPKIKVKEKVGFRYSTYGCLYFNKNKCCTPLSNFHEKKNSSKTALNKLITQNDKKVISFLLLNIFKIFIYFISFFIKN